MRRSSIRYPYLEPHSSSSSFGFFLLLLHLKNSVGENLFSSEEEPRLDRIDDQNAEEDQLVSDACLGFILL